MGQPRTILVVDDEEMIEEIIQAIVESHGCRTTSFTDPQDALRFLADNIDQVMLVITDLKMPSLPGPELIKQAVRMNPTLAIIAVSGRADEHPLDGIRESIQKIVAKPFTKSELIDAVDSALSKAGLQCPVS